MKNKMLIQFTLSLGLVGDSNGNDYSEGQNGHLKKKIGYLFALHKLILNKLHVAFIANITEITEL